MGTAMARLRGAFALAVLFSGRHDLLMGARRGSSLAVGYGDGAMYIGTDALALAPFTKQGEPTSRTTTGSVLHPGRCQGLSRAPSKWFARSARAASRGRMIGKGNHRHFMLKEIYEQPAVIGDTLHSYLNSVDAHGDDCRSYRSTGPRSARLTMTACGTAFYACMVAKYWFEQLARLPVEVEVASELRYREPPMPEGGVCIAVSQSGETVDTLAALRYAKAHRPDHPGGGQRAGKRHRPRIACRAADPGRPRDRRGLDQGLHHPAHRACCARRSPPAAPAAP